MTVAAPFEVTMLWHMHMTLRELGFNQVPASASTTKELGYPGEQGST